MMTTCQEDLVVEVKGIADQFAFWLMPVALILTGQFGLYLANCYGIVKLCDASV